MTSFNEDILLEKYHSYSSASSFEQCPHAFKLTYLDFEKREQNAFSEYGSFVHHIFELFWNKKLVNFQLADYYEKNYDRWVKTPFPPFPQMMDIKYFDDGLRFFQSFSLDADDYDVILIEDSVEFSDVDAKLKIVIKPDLIVREKSTGKVILFDYKSSSPKNKDGCFINSKGNFYDKKMLGYIRQLYVYKHYFEKYKQIKIDEIKIFFPRLSLTYTIDYTLESEIETIKWFTGTIKKAIKAKRFTANTENAYFCMNICGVRNSCKHKRKVYG